MKNLVLILLLLVITGTSHSQKPDTAKIIQKYIDKGPIIGVLNEVSDIEVFEYPKFKGRTGKFRWENGKLVPPFKPGNVSFRVPEGKIVYIRRCISDFPDESAYTGSVASADLSKVCGIRSDDLVYIYVQFNGISTTIHNNDCKRFFGSLKVKMYESAPDGAAQVLLPMTAPATFRPDAFTFQAFSHPSSASAPRLGNLVHNGNPVTQAPSAVVYITGGGGEAVAKYAIGASAVRDRRAGLTINADLGSAHKTCDLCDDFSSNVRMTAPVNKSFPFNRADTDGRTLNAANNHLTMGPLKARGSRDGYAITASGGTFLDFYAHFTVIGL